MEWTEAISRAVEYIEAHITEEITVEDIAKERYKSSFYFQKGFSMLCGLTISEYIRNRRLSLAGNELATSEKKVIDVALKYGYDSSDSFTKAFMVVGAAKTFTYESAKEKVPEFWTEYYAIGKEQYVCGMFGINIDEQMGQDTFEYLIADTYNPMMDVPEGCITKTIPAFTWAVFPCKGAMPNALQDVNVKIFSEWLPALRDYEFAAGYCIEMYDDVSKYPNGSQDENYYSEIWIPVKRNRVFIKQFYYRILFFDRTVFL